MEVLAAIDALEELLGGARRVPLTDQVRLDRDHLHAATERLRSAVTAKYGHAGGRDLAGVAAIEALVAEARPVPLTPQVRIDRVTVSERLQELRAQTVRS